MTRRRNKGRRRANGEGSFWQRRDGSWCAQYVVVLPNGARKRKTISGQSFVEVRDRLTQRKAEWLRGEAVDDDGYTLGAYLDRWLTESERGGVSEKTYMSYEGTVRLHIKPLLGHLRLRELTADHLRWLYGEKLAVGLSPRSVQIIHVVLAKALKEAVVRNLIVRAATDGVKRPRTQKREMRTLTSGQALAFLRAARGNRYEALYVLAVSTGLRRGELFGLKWEDMDFGRGILSVRRSVSANGKAFKTTKTGRGRTLRVTPDTATALLAHRTRQQEHRALMGASWREHGLVFPSLEGMPTNADNFVKRSFKPLLKKAGLPEIRFHDLRHTFATLLLPRPEVPSKVVQEMLGHSSIIMTLDTYSHVLPDMQGTAAEAMQEILSADALGQEDADTRRMLEAPEKTFTEDPDKEITRPQALPAEDRPDTRII